MKPVFILPGTLCLALMLPLAAHAQTSAPAKDKPAAKAAAPVKPKVRLMTRDELRTCLKEKEENRAENAAIEQEKTGFTQEREALVQDKDALLKRTAELDSSAKLVIAERDELMAQQKEFEKPVEKAEVKAMEAKRVAFNERAAAHGAKVDAYNAQKREYDKVKLALDTRIDANNARGRALKTRADSFNETVESYSVNCLNKPYDVADEAAVKKELQAAPK